MTNKWDLRFLGLAFYISQWSKDPSTKTGCVVVDPESRTILSTGYNGLPRGVEDTHDRLTVREKKLLMITHAETNALYAAARHGTRLEGATLYSTFLPCSVCCGAIIQAGIQRVVAPDDPIPERWIDSMDLSMTMFTEARITVTRVAVPKNMPHYAVDLHTSASVI